MDWFDIWNGRKLGRNTEAFWIGLFFCRWKIGFMLLFRTSGNSGLVWRTLFFGWSMFIVIYYTRERVRHLTRILSGIIKKSCECAITMIQMNSVTTKATTTSKLSGVNKTGILWPLINCQIFPKNGGREFSIISLFHYFWHISYVLFYVFTIPKFSGISSEISRKWSGKNAEA